MEYKNLLLDDLIIKHIKKNDEKAYQEIIKRLKFCGFNDYTIECIIGYESNIINHGKIRNKLICDNYFLIPYKNSNIIFSEPSKCIYKLDENVFEEPVILSEDQVVFIGDKAEYLHPEEAMRTLQPIAEYLIQHPSISILLAGTTAGDKDSDYTMTLSLSRAETVKSTLVELGVDEGRIIAVGLGSTNDPWHIWSAGYDGAAASSNRKVVLLDATSETAISILNQQAP